MLPLWDNWRYTEDTHSVAGGKEVNNVVVELSNVIADIQLDIFVP